MAQTHKTSRLGEQSRGKQSLRLWLRLLACENLVEHTVRARLRVDFEITLPQFDVLSELERVGHKMTMSELSRELMVSNGNVTGVIDRLEKSGFVTRTRAEHDRRVQYIDLTDRGRKEWEGMAASHECWLDDLLAGLTIDDMADLQALLIKTRDSVSS